MRSTCPCCAAGAMMEMGSYSRSTTCGGCREVRMCVGRVWVYGCGTVCVPRSGCCDIDGLVLQVHPRGGCGLQLR